jgi:tellurite resistance protein TehA-like permease
MDPSGLYANCQVAAQGYSDLQHECTHSRPQQTKVVVEQQLHRRNQSGWRRIVLHFTPSWFAVTMGTGIVSILLFDLPYNARWIYWISVVVYCFNIALFVAFTAISVLRYTIHKGIFVAMLKHPVQSLFLGKSLCTAKIFLSISTENSLLSGGRLTCPLGTFPMVSMMGTLGSSSYICITDLLRRG